MNVSRKTKVNCICVFTTISMVLLTGKQANADSVIGAAERLGPAINSPNPDDHEWLPRVHADGLNLTVFRNYGAALQVWISSRETKDSPWESAIRDVAAIGPDNVVPGVTTMDGLEFYTWMDLPGGFGSSDIYMRTREAIGSPWSDLVNIGPPVNTPYTEYGSSITPDGLELYISDYETDLTRPGGYGGTDLWVARRESRDAPWTEPENLGSKVNSSLNDYRSHISADGLLLFFNSDRPGGFGQLDLYMARRKSLSDPWEEAVNLGPGVNSTVNDQNPGISPDGCEIYFVRNNDIWQATIEPVVDLNSDGIVDADDVCIMVDNWGTDNTLCDIGPTPFGDGIVDVQDLIVLAEHLFEEIPPANPVDTTQ